MEWIISLVTEKERKITHQLLTIAISICIVFSSSPLQKQFNCWKHWKFSKKIRMESKQMKIEIPQETETVSPTSGHIRRQNSAKSNCLCSPTTHAGSFRCRLHRGPSVQRTKSMDSASLQYSTSKADTSNVEAQWF